jgi:uncharacterized protein (DUF885 family)
MKQLDALHVDALSPEAQVDYAVYHEQIRNFVAEQQFKGWQMPFNSDSAFWSDFSYQFVHEHPRRIGEYRRLLDQLAQLPAWFDQEIDNMRLGLARGFSVPRAVLDGRDKSIADVADLTEPAKSDYYVPFAHMSASIPAEQAQALQGEALRRIRDEVIPAYAKLLDFFRKEYLPKARTTLAAETLPDGKAYYRQQIREYTTLDLDPDAIHKMGLEQ